MSDERRSPSALRPRWSWALALVALVALAASGNARAQELEEAPAEEESAAGEESYEPDQRGNTDESEDPESPEARSDGGTGYEPDQRGAHDEPALNRAEGVSVSSESYWRDSVGPRLEIELSLGLAGTGLEVAGQNVVSVTERGGIGAAFALSAGLRVGPVLIGPRLALTVDPSFLLTHLALGADVELLEGDVVPFVRLAVGGTLVTPLGDAPSSGVAGLGIELGVGVRWRLGRGLFIGAELAGGWHHLWRAAVPSCTDGCTEGDFDLRRSGESDALSVRALFLVGYGF